MRKEKDSDIPDEQFQAGSIDDCPDIQVPLADRTIFQMDQTESENQVVSRNQQERRAESNLGGDVLLPAIDLHQVPDKIRLFVVTAQSSHSGNAFREKSAYRYTVSEAR